METGKRVANSIDHRELHEWEAYTVDKLKLGDIWEKTPFPLELPSASA